MHRSGLLAVPLLAQLVEAQLAGGDHGGARATVDERERVAARGGNVRVTAVGTAAVGRVARATGAPDCVELLGSAAASFARSGMSHEEARTRIELAAALRSQDDVLAAGEARAALEAFRRSGARTEVDRVAVEGRDAVVRLEVRYLERVDQEYRDLWVLGFAPDGRVEHFEEWAYWPDKPFAADGDQTG